MRSFLETPDEVVLDRLDAHQIQLWGGHASASQVEAWRVELAVIREALRAVVVAEEAAPDSWSIVLEYELPMEGGRRPDLVVHAGRALVVVEFKSAALPTQADLDQVSAYTRDLIEYHRASHDRPAWSILVPCGAAPGLAALKDDVIITAPEGLAHYLLAAAEEGTIDLAAWLDSPYEPLPALVEAARRIFRNEALPHVKRAQLAGVPEAVELLGRLADEAAAASGRVMAFVAGVPGAGKTLVGLRLVYERVADHGRATFLSGNGPLVAVLQDALASRVFVRDIHQFIRTYALNKRLQTPTEHVVVFDEGQRAWDVDQMQTKRGVAASEPDLLVQIGERIPEWTALVALIGDGQEIHVGEESGIEQWATAASPPNAALSWQVHCPPRLASSFESLTPTTHDVLDLTTSLRSHRAEQLHQWVALVLTGSLPLANAQALRFAGADFDLYVTRDLDRARGYARARYSAEPLKRYGLVASAAAKRPQRYGVDNGFMATSRMNVAKWFNAEPDDPRSCCALTQPVTEFGCQGLELDLPIVCWGEDYRRANDQWMLTPPRRRIPLKDPEQVVQNAYRVLLTRGRDGMVIWLPPDPDMDATETALLAAGVRLLPTADELGESLAAVGST